MIEKKIYVVIFVVFFALALFSKGAYADSFGTMTAPLEKGQWMMSLEGYYGVEKDLKYADGVVDSDYFGAYHGRGYGLSDRVSIFFKLGYYDLGVNPNPFTNKEEGLKGGMAGGVYLRGILFRNPESLLEVGVGGGFLYCSAHQNNGPKYDWREWQLGGYVSKEFGILVPYCGLKYIDIDSRLKFKQQSDQAFGGFIEVESDKKLGTFLGTNIYLDEDKDVYINCEVNFISSFEVGTGLYYRF